MSLRQTTQSLIAEAETASGYPVEVRVDSGLAVPAGLQMARGTTAMHVIALQSDQAAAADYHVCVQCGFILRFFAAAPASRQDLAGSPAGQSSMVQLLEHMRKAGRLPDLSLPQMQSFADRLLRGLGTQLRSAPVELRVNGWLAERFPELREVQEVMVRRQLQENSRALDARDAAPSKVFRASVAMNAAVALYWAGALHDDALTTGYRQAGYLLDGQGLLKTWYAQDASPEADQALIDAWATALSLRRWFQWVPYDAPPPPSAVSKEGQR